MKVTTLGGQLAAMILIVIVAVSAPVLCVASAAAPHVSHGCCAKTPQVGPRIAALRTCCAENLPNYFGAIPVVAGRLATSVFVVTAAPIHHDVTSGAERLAQTGVDLGRPPGPPTYVLISTFRL